MDLLQAKHHWDQIETHLNEIKAITTGGIYTCQVVRDLEERIDDLEEDVHDLESRAEEAEDRIADAIMGLRSLLDNNDIEEIKERINGIIDDLN